MWLKGNDSVPAGHRRFPKESLQVFYQDNDREWEAYQKYGIARELRGKHQYYRNDQVVSERVAASLRDITRHVDPKPSTLDRLRPSRQRHAAGRRQ
jgi:hypothetical protein